MAKKVSLFLIITLILCFTSFGHSLVFKTFDVPNATIETAISNIDDMGDISGLYKNTTTHGFLRINDSLSFFDFPGSTETIVTGNTNNKEVVVGFYCQGSGCIDPITIRSGFIYTDGSYSTFDIQGALTTQILDINDSRYIVGSYYDGTKTHGFVYTGPLDVIDPTKIIDIDFPGSILSTIAYDINNQNIIVGYYNDGTSYHGFIYTGPLNEIDPLKFKTIDIPGGEAIPHCINDKGIIVGEYDESGGAEKSFLYDGSLENIDPSRFQIFEYPGAKYTHATAINDLGTIVGHYSNSSDRTLWHGFYASHETLPPVTRNLFAWYTVESLKNFPDSSKIPTWTNSAGIEDFELVALNSNKPVYLTDGFKGNASVHFEMDTPMGTIRNIGLSGDPEFTIFFVGIIKTANGYDHPWIWGNGSSTGYAGGASDFEIQNFRVDYATGYSQDAMTPEGSFSGLLGEPVVVSFTRSPGPLNATTKIYINGVSQSISGSTLSPNIVNTPFYLGPTYSQYGAHSPIMEVVEILIFKRALSDFEVFEINTYLNNKLFNFPPIAVAGNDQSVHPGSLVTLDGSKSYDPDENYPLSYLWEIVSKPIGSTAALSEWASVKPTFFANLIGDYAIELKVKNSQGIESKEDSVLISTYNTPPIADPGPDQAVIQIGTIVLLDGSRSWDDDGDPIVFLWDIISKPSGSVAELSNPISPTPNFVADLHGSYVVSLKVSDHWSSSETKAVTVSFENIKPIADAGENQSILINNSVTLNGDGSYDANLDPLKYRWSVAAKPESSTAEIVSPNLVETMFWPDVPGEYIISLTVNDGYVNSEPSNINIMVISNQDAVTNIIQLAENAINSLDSSVFKNENMANALTSKLNAVLQKVDQGFYQDALDKLQDDILKKTNGCAEIGSPDPNDWIEDCESQSQVYPLVMNALRLLYNLL